MAFDERLALRVRAELDRSDEITERRMFGGISFLVRGNFACGIVGTELVVRVGKQAYDDALALPHARVMDFTGKPSPGWVYVAQPGIEADGDLQRWVQRGVTYALSLPAK